MSKILEIKAREVLDSRGNPTVECEIRTAAGISRASVPSGASTGSHEAIELRDGGERYNGLGVQTAIKHINALSKKLKDHDTLNLGRLDHTLIKLDGTPNKQKLGANAILAISMAAAKAGALAQGIPLYQHLANLDHNKKLTLPIPAFNIINGGKHAGNRIDFQEYMILPTGAKSFAEALQIGSETYHSLKEQLIKKYGKHSVNVGDEGGFAPQMNCIEEPLEEIMNVLISLGYQNKVRLAIDAAASTFWKHNHYSLEGKELTPDQLLERYEQLASTYPLVSIEDPFMEEDFEHFAELKRKLPIQIVGDDLLCTNPTRVKKAIDWRACNCLLLKINQIGTITEALNAASLAKHHHWNIMASHRSGETEDSFIADLAVGINAGQIKAGAPCRGERLAKYNQLLRIEEESKAKYAGKEISFS
ncbi:phosphopyruvate hydratase [Candidatus Woesearchaeota archaeon]|nr:phosphopyruvate hydratase [Candidatus Woesearchaeota archaeon]